MIGVSGIASAMARKCAYRPSCVGLLYHGATCSIASAPRLRARCEYSIAAAVELLPVPAITRARPRATSIVIAMTRWSSASVIVALSPVVPQGTNKRTPPVICLSTSARNRSSSIAPSALNGVTSAVAQPRIQSILIVIVLSSFPTISFRGGLLPADRKKRAGISPPLNNAGVVYDLVEYFRKFIHAFAANDPTRRQQRPGGKPLARTRRVRQRDLVRRRIKPKTMRARNVPGAR